MRSLATGLSALIALLVPSAAQAITPPATYEFCGGGAFTFCAFVNFSVTQVNEDRYTVKLVVVNRSGPTEWGAPGQITSVGLDQVLPPGTGLLDPSNFQLKYGSWDGTTFVSTADVCGTDPTCWNMAVNKTEGGGVKVDFDANTDQGNQWSLASSCEGTTEYWNKYPIFTCGQGDDISQWRPVQFSFDVNQMITSTEMHFKAIAGPASTNCTTAPGGENLCKPVVVPEPSTIVLLGTGLAAVVAMGSRRRKRELP